MPINVDDVDQWRPRLCPPYKRPHNSGESRMPPSMTQLAHWQPCCRALTKPCHKPALHRMRARGQCHGWGHHKGERARRVRTPPGLALQTPRRARGARLQCCRHQHPQARFASQTSDRLSLCIVTMAKEVFEARSGEHWVCQTPVEPCEDPRRCGGVQGLPIEDDDKGYGNWGGRMGLVHD